MKKISLLVLFSLLTIQTYCQSKYSFGIMASPDLTYINGSLGKNVGGATYATKPGYTLGLSIYKKLSKHFFVTTGVWYIDKGTKTFSTYIYRDSSNNIIATMPGVRTHIYRDLDIPLILNYTLGRTKFKFVCSMGLVFGFALKETMKSITAYQTHIYNVKENNRGPDRINLNFSIGASYKINDNYTLLFEPNYKIDLRAIANTIWDDSHSFGLRTTLIYRFKQ